MTIFYYTFIRVLRNKQTFFIITLIPIIMIFIPMLWREKSLLGPTLYGIVILYGAFLLAKSIMSDRVNGTIIRIFSAPIKTYEYLTQTLLAYSLLLTVQIGLIIIIGKLLYNWELILALKLFLCYTVFATTSIGFSIAWNSLFRSKIMSDAVFSVVISLMSILGGIFVPINLLPDVFKRVGMIFPTYWLSNALISLNQNNDLQNYLLSIAILMLFTVLYTIFGSKRRLE
ncbi:ABC transporter permease [Clostridium sp. AL.422]|uniref:ABC transporter permease n=1 Tax=Clostridium TaxID=1485 RepID=UPI00293DEBD7|nr:MULTISPECIES: ABC transporter permease [unclassified Clostridium]MDV4150214.1 ABC transporter permease [Clostridium sp. AL.422]